jgi:hypothetical protein
MLRLYRGETIGGDLMRAETQAVVDDITQSLALLRRHL